MSGKPEHFISVIIPTYCRPPAVYQCLSSLSLQAYPSEMFEVIVINDGGDPEPLAGLARQFEKKLQVMILHEPHRGVSGARAVGIGSARGTILAFLDDDITVPSNYLTAIDRLFTVHPDTQVAQVGLENADRSNLYGRAWKFALEQTLRINLRQESDGRLVSGILGGVMVARREVFTQVRFDLMLGYGREDADLRYQLKARDIPVYYVPQIQAFHHYRQDLRGYLTSFFNYGRGEFLLRRKWGISPSPFRYESLTSWHAFRLLLRAEGAISGIRIYCALWLKRHAGLWGVLYEAAASSHPESPARRWLKFVGLLVGTYARQVGRVGLGVLRGTLKRRHLQGQ